MPEEIITPQKGPQTTFLESPADVVIYGGAAGSGKSWALGLEGLRHCRTPGFVGVYLRREWTQISKAGGLLQAMRALWEPFGGHYNGQDRVFQWGGGGSLQLAHVQRDDTCSKFDGSEIALLAFDEVQHFTEYQFFYLLSRVRSKVVRPYVRATCNPNPDSWLANFLAWWIDDEGYPRADRAGAIRWFARVQDVIVWADSPEEFAVKYPGARAMSVAFIPAKLSDNAALVDADPEYRARLEALPRVERARLLGGNWKVRPQRGDYYRRTDFPIVEAVNWLEIVATVRHWDLAATVPSDENRDPDRTAGVRLGRYRNGRWIVLDCVAGCWRAHERDELIKRVAEQDGKQCVISLPQDPGQAGKTQVEQMTRFLAPYKVQSAVESGDKETRAAPCSSQVGAHNIDVFRGDWNESFFAEIEAFPTKGIHDDRVDALNGAWIRLAKYNRMVHLFS